MERETEVVSEGQVEGGFNILQVWMFEWSVKNFID